ncbi:MAG: superoxide dismutase [Verrucomicrobia bacterium]|nr:superoxide dismutase [Verrucomicrobiota bacterium]
MQNSPISRREALQAVAASAAVVALAHPPLEAAEPATPFRLSPLPYALDALEPHIDARTMEIHHGKHHAAYVNNLNKAVASAPDAQGKSLEVLLKGLNSLPEGIRNTVRNNGGGHYNHDLFWQFMSKSGGGEPKGELLRQIEKAFGSFTRFKEEFTKAGMAQFGSGWAWLLWNGKQLEIKALPNQDPPLFAGSTALLGVDVWEHAYYLKYQNRRADYLAAFFNVIHWDFVAHRMSQAARS